MKSKFYSILFLPLCLASAGAGEVIPSPDFSVPNNRLAEKPAWEIDVTEQHVTDSGDSYADIMGRDPRTQRVRGGVLQWKLLLQRPEQAQPDWPIVLEADESRVLRTVTAGGEKLGWDRSKGNLWATGEGGVLIPQTGWSNSQFLEFASRDIPQAYENGFGRLRLRPATANEVIVFQQEGKPLLDKVTVVNRSFEPRTVEVSIIFEDYFGKLLGLEKKTISLPAKGQEEFAIPGLKDEGKELYKIRIWGEVEGAKTYEYQQVINGKQITRQRPNVLQLSEDGWERAFVPGPLESNPPPRTGWVKHAKTISQQDYTSHWMWVRRKFTIPQNWPTGQRIQLKLLSVSAKVKVLLDSKPVAEAFDWELPGVFLLPDNLEPGSEHELCFGVTDYIVSLAPGIKPPAAGPMMAGGRALASPLGTTTPLGISVDLQPELVSVPLERIDWASVRTYVTSPRRIEVVAELINDGGFSAAASLQGTVLKKGKVVLKFDPQPATTTSKKKTVLLKKEWADPDLWNLENPNLYELRLELLDRSGKVLDTRRERFGFREIGLKGELFTLNGEVIKLNGGSHVYPTALTWPARPSPYRIIRHVIYGHGPTGSGTAHGIISANAADELGYVLKSSLSSANAHGADNYAWQLPETWDRFRTNSILAARNAINNPSIVMWDFANEISFRGPGEDKKMGELMNNLREFDPMRLVNIGGSKPFPKDVEVFCFHGWGEWMSRADYWFMHPEERPSYLKKGGYFINKPENEPAANWQLDLRDVGWAGDLYPGITNSLRHIGGKPVMFAEGVYQENIDTFPLFGHDAYLALDQPVNPDRFAIESSVRQLNMTGARRLQIQNARQAGLASTMIHVDGGTGRYLLPVASFSWDRRVRFQSGETMKTRFGIHYDLSFAGKVTAEYTLYDGEKKIGEKKEVLDAVPGSINYVDLDFPLPKVESDRTLDLRIRVNPETGGSFYDSVPITVYAPFRTQLPEGIRLGVFDPNKAVIPYLNSAKIPYVKLAKPSDWKAGESRLLIGPEALTGVASEELAALGKEVTNGGQVIVLQHMSLPQFLPRNLVQNKLALSYAARLDDPSPVTAGLLTEDFRAWMTREKDQVVVWNPLETPSSGHFRAHLNAGRNAPVLELGEGGGRVLFVQLNLKDALGVEPAAARVMANLLGWLASPSPFPKMPTILVASDGKFVSALQSRTGLDAPVLEKPAANDLEKAALIILSGKDAAARDALKEQKIALLKRLENGATLFVYGLDKKGAEWISEISGETVGLNQEAYSYAYLTGEDVALTKGLGHGDFFVNGLGKGVDLKKPLESSQGATGVFTPWGKQLVPLTLPAYLSEIPVGKGRILLNLVQSLEAPQPSQARILSMLLSNAGASLDPEGVATKDKTVWKFQPIDLSKQVNWPLRDNDDSTKPRGWNASGESTDLRNFPTGLQNLRGVDYLITPPEKANGNSVIMIAGKNAKLGGVKEVTGIKLNAKAERLYFLHNSAWGVPSFIYRIYYEEDRKAWIPGKPDPYVDVQVKAAENINEWVYASAIDRSERFMSGATVAWLGDTKEIRQVGVYQMVWDNPHPEKTIESIDILSPQTEGSGQAYIFGITAARRDTSEVKPAEPSKPAPPLEKVLPKEANASELYRQIDFARYGFVLMKDGTVGSVYDAAGQPFAMNWGWKAEAAPGEPGQKGQPIVLGKQSDAAPVFKETQQGNRRVIEIQGDSPAMTWKVSLVATPSTLRYQLNYTPKTSPPEGYTGRLSTGLKFIGDSKMNISINENPIPVETPSGQAFLGFERRYTTWVFNYELWGNLCTFKSPPKDNTPYKAGQEESLWWELSVP